MINEPFCGRIDCFANHNSGLCRVLQSGYYGHKSCPFYKTNEQHALDIEKSKQRLISLGNGIYEKYSKKYGFSTEDPTKE